MSKRVINHRLRPSVLRNRGAVVAAGLGAVMVVGAGAGVASADAGKAAVADPATAVAAQADAQAKAAANAKLKAAAAKAAKAKAAKKKAVAWDKPVGKYTLTATFGKGGSMWSHKHSGQDFAVPVGTRSRPRTPAPS